MSTISNDQEFRAALDTLSTDRQRAVGALFVENVLQLSDDRRIGQAIAAARDSALSEEDLNAARRSAKAASLEAHTRCGADGEWSDQAGYFVARAAEACVEPVVRSKGKNPGVEGSDERAHGAYLPGRRQRRRLARQRERGAVQDFDQLSGRTRNQS